MKVIFDFDDVIFNAKAFKEYMFLVLEKNGYEDIRAKYEKMRGSGVTFSLYSFIKSVTFDSSEENVQVLYEKIISSCPLYINQQIFDLMTALGKENCSIVTHGDHEFQMDKIRRSVGTDMVKDIVVVSTTKAEAVAAICDRYNDEEVIFVDDKLSFINDLDFEKCSNLKTVLFNENGLANLKAEIAESLQLENIKMKHAVNATHAEQMDHVITSFGFH